MRMSSGRWKLGLVLGVCVLIVKGGLVLQAGAAAESHPKGGDLEIRWTLLENAEDARSHRARWSITNRGKAPLAAKGWTIYFNMLHMATRRPILESPPTVQITHFSGDLLKLQPTAEFPELLPGTTYSFEYRGVEAVNKQSWGPQGVYIVFENEAGEEEQPELVGKLTIDPFTRPEQINRGTIDQTPIPTPEYLHEQNSKLSLLPPEKLGKVTPTPVVYQERGGSLTLKKELNINPGEVPEKDAQYLAKMLTPVLGIAPEINPVAQGSQVIFLKIGEITVQREAKGTGSEAYVLDVDANRGVTITGADADGVFYGIQTLLQLLPPTAFAGGEKAVTIPTVHIEDAPRFKYRGQHIDVSHNFHSKESILKLLDRMAFYKLNKFHFQVSDDEGWRIEIPELPELTAISGGRAHTRDHDGALHPTYGAGPFRDPPTFGSGFYTRADYIEIIKHAHNLHIEVIPEINLPAHARGAIIAMKAREKRLMAEGKPEEALKYRLHDPSDTSIYTSAQGFLDNAVIVTEEPIYAFAELILTNFEEMFREAGVPLRIWHFGADEVPTGVWTKSPLAQKFLAAHPEIQGPAGLKDYFVRRITEIINRHKLQAACWQEAALNHVKVNGQLRDEPIPEFSGGMLIPYIWNNLSGNEDLSNRFANMGYPVVLCCVSNLYFDLAYNKDPLEPGLTWGGFCDARNPFELVPEDLFKSTKVDNLGHFYNRPEMYRQRESLTAQGLKNTLGIQGQIWCETIKGPKMLEYYVYPKQISLAERAWSAQPGWARLDDLNAHDAALQEAWNEFANRLAQRELPRLDSIFGGIGYRLPPPGAVILEGKLHASSEYPGLVIRYTTDGSDPTAKSAEYTGPVAVTGKVKVATFDSRGRASRPSILP